MMPKACADVEALLMLAGECDEYACKLGDATKQLYDKVWDLKSRNNGRGPTGVTVTNALERVTAKYFSKSNIVRTRRGIHPSFRTFHETVSTWVPSLSSSD
jgi:hypothetical protein